MRKLVRRLEVPICGESLRTPHVSLRERADEREPGFVALVAATGIAKLAGAIVPLWLVFSPPSRVRRLSLLLCWVGGLLLALYGLTDIVTGSIRAARGTMENAIWYTVLWGPIGALGCCS